MAGWGGATHVRLHRWEGLDFGVGRHRGRHGNLSGQAVGRRAAGFLRVSRSAGGQTHSAPWRRTGEHHAVELADVGGETVHHAANLLHQRAL